MKTVSNTLIAAIMAVVLTAFVALFLQLSFGQGLETWMGDKMISWRYELTKKTHPPDPRLVFVAIDQQSVDSFGRWPFSRGVHGQFLDVLAPNKPKVVAWDIFFTERMGTSPTVPEAPAETSAPSTAPAPTGDGTTNAAPATPSPTTGTETSTDKSVAASTSPAAPTPAQPPAVVAAENAPSSAPDSSLPATTMPDGSPVLQPDDQALVEGATQIPHMVTVGASDPTSGLTLEKDDTHPTVPLKNVHGDISKLQSSTYAVIPFPELRKVSYFGFADAAGKDARRTIPLIININGKVFPSFDLQVLMQYFEANADNVVVNLGQDITIPRQDGTKLIIPIGKDGQFLVNYRARSEDFHGMGYALMGKGLADLANKEDSEESKHLPPLKDNIVVIGVTLSGTDQGYTPLDPYSPLVIAHLNLLNNVLQQDYLHELSAWIWIPLYAIFLFAVGNLMLRVGIAPMIPIGAFAMLILGCAAFGALWHSNILVPVLIPEIGILLLGGAVPTKRFFGEEREKLRVKNAMRAYLSEKVMTKILAHPDNVKLGGVKQVITIMFCDIRGFTKYCDDRDSQEVLTVLNEYMEEMTQVVFKYDGTVDKYIGDCIMAFWNAPELQPDHAQRAVCCAMEMRYALANFKTKRAGKDVELFECGIGIHTGEALVGNMGSSLKLNYTAMGSTVNMGARLEALTKRLNERILISEDTRNQLQGDFPLTDRGEATVAGFAKPVHVFAVGADQDIGSALSVGRTLAGKQEYTAEEVKAPIWKPAPLPSDADPNP